MSDSRYITDELPLDLGDPITTAVGQAEAARRSYGYSAWAACSDCEWTGDGAGVLGRAAQHHDRTGHEVKIKTSTTYHRRGAPPGQPELEGMPDA